MKKTLWGLLIGVVAFMIAESVRAEAVSVSTITATTVVSSNSGRKHLILQNRDTDQVIYYAKYTSSATATLGNVLALPGTTGDLVVLMDYTGPVYALGQSSAGAATADLRYFQVLK